MTEQFLMKMLETSQYTGLYIIALILLWATGLVILYSVIYKFVEKKDLGREKTKRKKSVVETFTMAIIIIAVFNFLQMNKGIIKVDFTTALFALIFGLTIALISTVMHLRAKKEIGKYWSNQIEIMENHRIVTSGVFSVVRHPGYSSLIFWLIGFSIAYVNYIALLLTLLLFVPMMIYRARAEDELLNELDETAFKVYKSETHMLIPRFGVMISYGLRILIILLLAYSIVLEQMYIERVILLALLHFTIGLITSPAKVRFSYRNKSVFLVIIYILTVYFPAAFFFILYCIDF